MNISPSLAGKRLFSSGYILVEHDEPSIKEHGGCLLIGKSIRKRLIQLG